MSFRRFLQSELSRRRARNPRYSLRAFARALATDHSTLSQIVRGKRRLTPDAIRRLAARLKLAAQRVDEFCTVDSAILDLVGSDLFAADSRRIAALLGISTDDVNIALQRLLRLRRLAMTRTNAWEVFDDGQPGDAVADRGEGAGCGGEVLLRPVRLEGAGG